MQIFQQIYSRMIEDVLLNRRPDATERLLEVAEYCQRPDKN